MHIRVLTEHVTPVLLVTLLSLRNLQQDFAVGTLGAASQVAVDTRLRLFISQLAAPTLNLRGRRVGDRAVAGRLVLALEHLGLFAVLVLGVRAHSSLSTGAVRAGRGPCA